MILQAEADSMYHMLAYIIDLHREMRAQVAYVKWQVFLLLFTQRARRV